MPTIDGRRDAVSSIARDATTHAGMWLDKYLSTLRLPGNHTNQEEDPAQGKAIRALLEEAGGTAIPAGYERALNGRKKLLEGLNGGASGGVTSFFKATARGRLIVGLGTHSVRETNISLLHTWGVPYLPGSALKGLASAAAGGLSSATDWKRSPEQGPDHALLFGNTTQAGHVVFHDAWWIPGEGAGKLPLDIDVMTVHHPEYYGDGKTPPADWDEPNPVAFLTAYGDYMVALSGPKEWVTRAGEWLEMGLLELGIGAKTQAGYGRMTLERELTEQEIEQRRVEEAQKLAEQQRLAQFAQRIQALRGLLALGATASNAKTHMQKLCAARAEGVPAEAIREITRGLFERDRKTWRGWDKQGKWSAEQRALLVDAGIVPETPEGKSG